MIRRAVQLLAPVLVTVAALAAAVVVESIGTFVLVQEPLSSWLMRHETWTNVIALAQFASFFVASAVGVRMTTGFLMRRGKYSSRIDAHLWHSSLLHIALIIAGVSQVRCIGYCEGLILGSIKFFGLTALGGILANGWVLRSSSVIAHAA